MYRALSEIQRVLRKYNFNFFKQIGLPKMRMTSTFCGVVENWVINQK